jgi:hypothetical protein
MYWDDHEPPHFHVRYGGSFATVSIQQLELLTGRLSGRTERLVLEWAAQHQTELMENWDLCRQNLRPHMIDPLE